MSGAGRLEALDAVFDLGVLAVAGFQRRDVGAVLVGDEALEAMAVEVGEGELRAGVWALAPADQPRALRPAFEVDVVGQLGDPRAVSRLPVSVDRSRPCLLPQGEDRVAGPLVDRVAKRETDPGLPAR